MGKEFAQFSFEQSGWDHVLCKGERGWVDEGETDKLEGTERRAVIYERG